MKKQHQMNLFFILVVVAAAYSMGVFDKLFKSSYNYPSSSVNNLVNNQGYNSVNAQGYNQVYNQGYMQYDPEYKYRSTDGIESNEQYSNPNNIGVDGDLYARGGRYRKFGNPYKVGNMNIM